MGTFKGKIDGHERERAGKPFTVVISIKIVSDKRSQADGVRDLVRYHPFDTVAPRLIEKVGQLVPGDAQSVSRQAVKLPKHTKL
jgi:hypothetical protein